MELPARLMRERERERDEDPELLSPIRTYSFTKSQGNQFRELDLQPTIKLIIIINDTIWLLPPT